MIADFSWRKSGAPIAGVSLATMVVTLFSIQCSGDTPDYLLPSGLKIF
jgi:hypothetical protein